MKFASKLVNGLIIIATASSISTKPAQADLSSVLKNLSVGLSSWDDIDNRRAQIENQIASALSQGKLTSDEATTFRTQLAAVTQAETQLKASGKSLSFTQAFTFSNQLNSLGANIEQIIQSKTALPATGDLDSRIAAFNTQISDAHKAGQLTPREEADLKRQLERLEQITEAFKASNDGPLTAKQQQILKQDCDKLEADLRLYSASKASGSTQVDALQAQLEKKINDAAQDGHLSQSEGNDFKQELQRIAVLETSFKTSYGGLSNQEVLTLLSELDQLNSRIDQQVLARVSSMPDIDGMQCKLSKVIADKTAAGKLTALEGEDLKRELDNIALLENAYKASGGGLSSAEAQTLSLRLEQLNARVEQQSTSTPVANDIDKREAELRKKVNEGLTSAILSQRESDRFMAELDDIEDEETSYRYDDGTLSDEDRIAISGDLDRLNIRLSQLFRIRRGGQTDITAKMNRLLKRINEGVSAGKLTPLEASLLRMEYNRIVKLEHVFRTSQGGLSYSEVARLSNDLDKLDTLVSQEVNNRNAVPRMQ